MATLDSGIAVLVIITTLAPVGVLLSADRDKTGTPPIRTVGLLGILFNWAVLYGLSCARPSATPWLLLAAAGLIAGGICVLLLVFRRQEARVQADALTLQRKRMQEFTQVHEEAYRDLQEQIVELRQLRHDLRHYLVAASGGAEPYTTTAWTHMERPVPQASVLDELVEYYAAQAKDLGTETDIRLDLGETGGIAVSDLCLVVGNLLENAVEAVRRQGGGGLIRMRCASGLGWLSIVTGNTFSGRLRTVQGRYLSSKAKNRQGTGLESVRRVAEQYSGSAAFKADGTMFMASVFLTKPHAAGNAAVQITAENAPEVV